MSNGNKTFMEGFKDSGKMLPSHKESRSGRTPIKYVAYGSNCKLESQKKTNI